MTDASKEQVTTAILVFAHYLGIDLDKEQDLLWIAEEAFEKLPSGWEFGIGEGEHAGIPYFYNEATGQSDWKHPLEDVYIKKIAKERQVRKEKAAQKRQQQQQKEKETSDQRGRDQRDSVGREAAKDGSRDQRDSSRDRPRDTNNNNRSKEVEEVTEIEELEDLDTSRDVPHSTVNKNANKGANNKAGSNNSNNNNGKAAGNGGGSNWTGSNNSNNSSNRDKASTNNNYTSKPAFGMSEDDFVDSFISDSTAGPAVAAARDERARSPVAGNKWLEQDSDRDHPRSKADNNPRGGGNGVRGKQEEEERGRGRAQLESPISIRSQSRSPSPQQFRRETSNSNNNNRDNSRRVNFREENDRSNSRGRVGAGYNSSESDRDRDRDRNRERSSPDRSNRNSSNNSGFSLHDKEDLEFRHKREVELFEQKVAVLREDKDQLLKDMSEMKLKAQQEGDRFKDDLQRLEDKLATERRERKDLEDQYLYLQQNVHSKVKEAAEAQEVKDRELLRKQRQEVEDEFKEKLRKIERRGLDEADVLQSDISGLKRQVDDLLRENDVLKRKVIVSKDDGRQESLSEVEKLREKLRSFEEEDRKKSLDLKKAKDDVFKLQQQLLAVEQHHSTNRVVEEQQKLAERHLQHELELQQAMYLQAMSRIQTLEQDLTSSKVSLQALEKEHAQVVKQYKQQENQSHFTKEHVTELESEKKRIRLQSQAEVSRLQNRAIEQDALIQVLRNEVEKGILSEGNLRKQLQIKIDSLENDTTRLQDRNSQLTMREEELQSRIRSQEKELIMLQEQVFRKEKQIKEEVQKCYDMTASISTIRREYEDQISNLKKNTMKFEDEKINIQRKFEDEKSVMQQEVMQKTAEIVKKSIDKVSRQLEQQHNHQLEEVQQQFEERERKVKKEMQQLKMFYEEKEVRKAYQFQEQSLELTQLRQQVLNFKIQPTLPPSQPNWQVMVPSNQSQAYYGMGGYDQNQPPSNHMMMPPAPPPSSQQQHYQQPSPHYPPSARPSPAGQGPNQPFFQNLVDQSFQAPTNAGQQIAPSTSTSTALQSKEQMVNDDMLLHLQAQLNQMKEDVKRVSQSNVPTPAASSTRPKSALLHDDYDHFHHSKKSVHFDADDINQHYYPSSNASSAAQPNSRSGTILEAEDISGIHLDVSTLRSSGAAESYSSKRRSVEEEDWPAISASTPFNQSNASFLNVSNSAVMRESIEDLPSFENIQDGGYYEGYWRAKYGSNSGTSSVRPGGRFR